MVHEVEDSIMQEARQTNTSFLRHFTQIAVTLFVTAMFVLSCSSEEKQRAEAINENDSLPFLQSYGISTLISDSGVIRYKIIAEQWDIYNTTNPPLWTFVKGIFMEKFDSTFHVDWYVQSDTAYCHNQKLWELRGRVNIRNQEGTVFTSEELFWDMDKHEMYSNMFMTIRKPNEFLQGYNFRSNEQMTRYTVTNANADTPFKNDSKATESDTTATRPAPTKNRQS